MLNFIVNRAGAIKDITNDATPIMMEGETLINRNDITTYEQAVAIAEEVTNSDRFSKTYMAIDKGRGVSPRYDVIEAPQVGDPVSKTINGDYYPCGYIVRISKTGRRVETDTGDVFIQKLRDARPTGKWGQGKSFGMVRGHHNVRNPHV